MFMSTPQASPNVPVEFWTESMEKEIINSIQEFKKHADMIERGAYIDDLTSGLVSFAMR